MYVKQNDNILEEIFRFTLVMYAKLARIFLNAILELLRYSEDKKYRNSLKA